MSKGHNEVRIDVALVEALQPPLRIELERVIEIFVQSAQDHVLSYDDGLELK